MNGTLKRVAVACMVMFGLLLLNVNYLQAVKAEEYREDNRNFRRFFQRYENQRGRIIAGNEVIAESVDTKGDIRFERRYRNGRLYAHVIGFFAPESERGIEAAQNKLLDGTSADLVVRRAVDLLTNKPTRGADIELTIDPRAQRAAYESLRRAGRKGAVVALDPQTGAIKAMVSLPTYDPNELAVPNKGKVAQAYNKLDADKDQPLLNRAIETTYAPGSTYKVVTTAALLSEDDTVGPQTTVDAPQVLDLPGTSVGLPNYAGAACGSGRVTLQFALEKSCNTPFAKIGMELGYEKMKEQAARFGIGEPLQIPLNVAPSSIGKKEDDAALAMASIGQRSVQMTPLQMAMVAAAVANDGTVMKPYLVDKVVSPDGDTLEETEPDELSEAMSPDAARKLRQMMVSVVAQGTATAAQIPGVTVGGKTGTAETSDNAPPHAWFIGFAPAENPKVAVCVFVQSGAAGDRATGGGTAAPVAREVMQAVLRR
ncbi:penicillin-binding protein A [Thermopolyspora flexuosa]|jgi:peptidoglycan glycosyltransferase|uniref:Cell elongation-specific peptidoglycan D,D-transpeptidase n=1 Tax=Thermopolyspora flexuosa TaxID=103836 RepID=A0A543IPH2_9ACTN|nr:penicillin-binding protein 2 [Thermopolyspora flexuosa]TQM72475.1 cell elongation-specific peptidoglycan D,D-transpeptidase [Thermopolyspora flexuosa]GGM70356.1 penicillin-binding protein A [Thermopolyspora flexuosa]